MSTLIDMNIYNNKIYKNYNNNKIYNNNKNYNNNKYNNIYNNNPNNNKYNNNNPNIYNNNDEYCPNIYIINHSKKNIINAVEELDDEEIELIVSDLLNSDPLQGDVQLQNLKAFNEDKKSNTRIGEWTTKKIEFRGNIYIKTKRKGYTKFNNNFYEYFLINIPTNSIIDWGYIKNDMKRLNERFFSDIRYSFEEFTETVIKLINESHTDPRRRSEHRSSGCRECEKINSPDYSEASDLSMNDEPMTVNLAKVHPTYNEPLSPHSDVPSDDIESLPNSIKNIKNISKNIENTSKNIKNTSKNIENTSKYIENNKKNNIDNNYIYKCRSNDSQEECWKSKNNFKNNFKNLDEWLNNGFETPVIHKRYTSCPPQESIKYNIFNNKNIDINKNILFGTRNRSAAPPPVSSSAKMIRPVILPSKNIHKNIANDIQKDIQRDIQSTPNTPIKRSSISSFLSYVIE
eukprot:GHVL01037141.1.p1 GENE.GHVL01037141.1~~GHVL01037141.1.p1  ORF type:complete len:459 (-),score=183.55 GHVL01037141.1:648-2024(-)